MSNDDASIAAPTIDSTHVADADAHRLKRKASPDQSTAEADSTSPKRARLDSARNDRNESAGAVLGRKDESSSRRASTSQEEEKKRGRRLFGGLLSTLSQTTKDSPQQRKRQDIERRQQARTQQRRAEDDKQRTEKLAKLKQARRAEQIKFDEQVMKTRHSNLLAQARFLQTKNEPKIFYLPWECTKRQENTIEDQIRDAEDAVEKETREFKQQKAQRLQALGLSVPAPALEQEQEPGKEQGSEMTDAPAAASPSAEDLVSKPDTESSLPIPESTNDRSSPMHDAKDGKDPDEHGDVVVEDEDTVIY